MENFQSICFSSGIFFSALFATRVGSSYSWQSRSSIVQDTPLVHKESQNGCLRGGACNSFLSASFSSDPVFIYTFVNTASRIHYKIISDPRAVFWALTGGNSCYSDLCSVHVGKCLSFVVKLVTILRYLFASASAESVWCSELRYMS